MKAVLEFNLPEDESDFRSAADGWKWKASLQELDNYLRNLVKHGNHYKDVDDALEDVRTNLLNAVRLRDLDLFD